MGRILLLGDLAEYGRARRAQHERIARDGVEAEVSQRFLDRDRLDALDPAAGPRQQAAQHRRADARFLQRREAGVAVAFRESSAVGADDERDMGEVRGRVAERLVQQQLARRRGDQVVASDDFRHALGRVVHDDGELIRRSGHLAGSARRLPDDEVPADLVEVDRAAPAEQVVETRRLIGKAKTPGERLAGRRQRVGVGGRSRPARPRIDRPLLFEVWRAGRTLDVAASAGAGIDGLPACEAFQGGAIEGEAVGLDDDIAVPVEAEPA